MSVQQDWLRDAAEHLASFFSFGSGSDEYVTDEQRKNVADNYYRFLVERSPFKPDVAYMPVPRCDACRWWREHHCQRLVDSSGLRHGSKAVALEDNVAGRFARLMTDADFGCVQWEAR